MPKINEKIGGSFKIYFRTSILLIICLFLFANPSLSQDSFSDFLPFGKQWVIEQGSNRILPLPIGVNANLFYQEQDLIMEELSISSNLPIPMIDELQFKANSLESKVITYTLKLDAWLLPFLNVYTVIGSAKGETIIDAKASHPEIPYNQLVTIVGGEQFLDFVYDMDYNGITLGYGSTLVGGTDHLFGSLDFNYTYTNLDIADSSIETLNITPRVGWMGNLGSMGSQLWVGAMYQDMTQNIKGSAPFPGLPEGEEIDFDVTQKAKNNWNYLFGGRLNISKVWHMLLEVGAGARTSFYGSAEYRF